MLYWRWWETKWRSLHSWQPLVYEQSKRYFLFVFVCFLNKCLENIKQTRKWLFKVLLFHLSYIYFETKVEIEKLFFAISYEVITIFSFL